MNLHPDASAHLVAHHRDELRRAAVRASVVRAVRPRPRRRNAVPPLVGWWQQRRVAPATTKIVIDLSDGASGLVRTQDETVLSQ